MRFINKYSDSSIRLLFVLITLYCLLISGIPFFRATFSQKLTMDGSIKKYVFEEEKLSVVVAFVPPESQAEKAGLKSGDVIKNVNGRDIRDIYDLNRVVSSTPEGFSARYIVERDGVLLSLDIGVYRYFHLVFYIFFSLGFVFLVNGFLVGYSRPKEFSSQIFFFLGCAASLGFLYYGGVWHYTGFNNIFHYSFLAGISLFYPLFLHFFTIYPIKYEFRKRKLKIFLAYLYILIIILIPNLIDIDTSNKTFETILEVIYYTPFLYLVAGIVLFINSYRKISDTALKKSLRIILYGFLIGGTGLIYYFLIFTPMLSRGGINFNPLYRLPAIFVLAIPFSFAYSIFKYKILDTEIIVKKILVFGILALFITVVYLMLLYIINTILVQYTGDRTILTVASIVIIIFTFDYVNKWANNFVDKRFYRKRYNYRKSLLDFSEELPFINNMREVIEKVNFAIREAMGISIVKFWIIDEEFIGIMQSFYRIKDKGEGSVYKTRDMIFKKIFDNDTEHKFLYNSDLAGMDIPDEHSNFIKKEGIVLSVPITIKDRLIGAINFGRKPFDTPYSDEDIDLLKTIAIQTAIIFENSRLKINETKKQKMEEELKIAKNIQNALIPKSDMNISRLDISGITEPAKEVGGDFFDYIRLDDNNILITIADVSGKGVPAALYMTKLQALLRFASKIFKTPKSILCEVNKQIYRKLEKNFFVTMNLALFNISEGKMQLSRAGHNPVLFFRDGECRILQSKGMGLGLDNEKVFNENLEEIEIGLRKNDVFIFYTDGLDEAMNKNREEYGLKSIIDITRKNVNSDAKELQNVLMEDIKRHRNGAEQNDDISMVIIKIKE
ncbi:MAG: SpoIIE family protein phosphatase [Ignavibacteriae bacterium]|nr:SpoIIE family protein phosphatase [Ignavibacteriota bacterium]